MNKQSICQEYISKLKEESTTIIPNNKGTAEEDYIKLADAERILEEFEAAILNDMQEVNTRNTETGVYKSRY